MESITPLLNTPSELITQLTNLAYTISKKKSVELSYRFTQIAATENGDLKKLFPHSPDVFLLFELRKGLGIPHCDLSRKSFMQVPISADLENSATFSVKKDETNLLTEIPDTGTHKYLPEKKRLFWKYDEKHFDHYNYATPYIQNGQTPHGGYVNSNTPTLMWSITFENTPYDELVEHLKDWQ